MRMRGFPRASFEITLSDRENARRATALRSMADLTKMGRSEREQMTQNKRPLSVPIPHPESLGRFRKLVMPGLLPGIHVFASLDHKKAWMAGT
jgi:hypothetical protein